MRNADVGQHAASGNPEERDPDRLLPADPRTRAIARDLYARVADAPIVSPHGHVPVDWLVRDIPFHDPTSLLISHDHYVTRLLHASGVDLGALGVAGSPADPREAWRIVAERWSIFAGTASGYWLEEELAEVLGITEPLNAGTADRIYDRIQQQLDTPQFRPRALFKRFGIEVLATTDDPLDDLRGHAHLAGGDLPGRVIPTFRPDQYLDPQATGFRENVERLLASASAPATFDGYLAALEGRREHFRRHGAVSTDHGVEEAYTVDMSASEAASLFQQVVTGRADATQTRDLSLIHI